MDNNKKKKALVVSTLLLVFCIGIITLFCVMPTNNSKEVLETFKVSFDPNDGGNVAAIEIEDGKALQAPEDPTREGYIFVGWMLGDELYDFSQSVTGDITLKAAWQELEPDKVYYTVTFATDGGTTFANQVIESGQPVVRPADPVKDGFEFKGWQVNGLDYNFDQPVLMDLTIVAVWEQVEEPEDDQNEDDQNEDDQNEDEDKTYTVRFNGNGGTLGKNCGTQTIDAGGLARNVCTATRAGYTLVGFNTSKSASSSNISSRRINSNTTFYAIWRANPKTYYNLSFNLNGGSGSCATKKLESGSAITSALNSCKPTKKYYTLSKWVTSGGGNASGTKIYNNMTVRAEWTKQKFKVTCTQTGGIAGQECLFTISGVSNSDIDSISYYYSGVWINATKYGSSYKMNNALFSRVSSFRITIDGEVFDGAK